MNIFKKIIILLVVGNLYSSNEPQISSIQEVFKDNNISINTKTCTGWIRVLLSEEKREFYKLDYIDQKNILYYIIQLKEIEKEKQKGSL